MINIDFDFRSDAGGKDPDSHSPTLRSYHKVLWSRDLPSGVRFELSDSVPGSYLHHKSSLGEFRLSSDSVMPTFTRWKSMQEITNQMSADENHEFQRITYTIGGMILFPGNRVDKKATINGARGMNRAISDRFDLTLECIRRFYLGLGSPLSDALDRYPEFFALFEDFNGYCEFFLLQDLVDSDGKVQFFLPFNDFKTSARPGDVDSYREFRCKSISFVEARNARIEGLGL